MPTNLNVPMGNAFGNLGSATTIVTATEVRTNRKKFAKPDKFALQINTGARGLASALITQKFATIERIAQTEQMNRVAIGTQFPSILTAPWDTSAVVEIYVCPTQR